MKKLICFATLMTLPVDLNAHAETEVQETLIHDTTTRVFIELNEESVICSSADYSLPQFKILIPELAVLTLLDHQNMGAGAPCVAAGECSSSTGLWPESFLWQSFLWQSPDGDIVDIRVQATRVDLVDHDLQTCSVVLKETVNLTVGEIPFLHEEEADLGARPYHDCLMTSLSELGDDGEYSYGESEEPDEGVVSQQTPEPEGQVFDGDEETAGCSTTDGPSGSMFVFLGLWALSFRRQRRSDYLAAREKVIG